MKSSEDMVTDSNRVSIGTAANPEPFSLTRAPKSPVPVLIAVPHAGRQYSPDVLSNMRDPAHACTRLEDRFVDLIAYEATKSIDVSTLIANTPRAVLDLNRSVDDVDWTMIVDGPKDRPRNSLANRRARSGLGLVPRRLPGHGEIWRKPLEYADLNHRIDAVHKPYHNALGQELARIRDIWGAALLVDLHSMPPLRTRPGEQNAAEFVIGDRFGASCSNAISSLGLTHLGAHRRIVAHNRPYSGGFVLDAHAAPRRGIHAIQLEICRSTYLDTNLEEPTAQISELGSLVAGLISVLGAKVAEIGERGGYFAQAAE